MPPDIIPVDCDACEGSGWIEGYSYSLRCQWCKGTGQEEIEIVTRTLDDLEEEAAERPWHHE